jgi:hypothetical protein
VSTPGQAGCQKIQLTGRATARGYFECLMEITPEDEEKVKNGQMSGTRTGDEQGQD